jgi:hypothetical protein
MASASTSKYFTRRTSTRRRKHSLKEYSPGKTKRPNSTTQTAKCSPRSIKRINPNLMRNTSLATSMQFASTHNLIKRHLHPEESLLPWSMEVCYLPHPHPIQTQPNKPPNPSKKNQQRRNTHQNKPQLATQIQSRSTSLTKKQLNSKMALSSKT